MKSRPENAEPAQVLGFLGTDKVLYCSRDCAAKRGQASARPVDAHEYHALAEAGGVKPAVVCPVCGSEYPFELATDEEARS